MDRVRFLQRFAFAPSVLLAITFNLSCSSAETIAEISSSSGVLQEYAYCVFPETQFCLTGHFTACAEGSLLSNSCPFVASSSSSSSSEDRGCSIQGYKTAEIGTQTWMAENLNCVGEDAVNPVGKCYNNDPLNCNIYGRLYDWSTAKWICPSGWHLPTDAEWDILVNYAGGSDAAGTKLKAKSGWNNNGNGTDNYGFSALPGGINSVYISTSGAWWSATGIEEQDARYGYRVYYKGMNSANGGVARGVANGTDGPNNLIRSFLSVRCLKNR